LSADGLTAGLTGERLAMIPFFRGIPAEQLERIAEWFVPEHHHPGHVLFRENDPGDKFYVIVRGAVAVHKRGVRVSVLEEGDHFGEIALLNDVPRTADIIIHRPTTLLSLQGSWLRRLMDDFPTIRQALEQSLKERSAS
jgi:ATP-binding cassette subfamily B protein